MQYHQGFRVDDLPLRRVFLHLELFAKNYTDDIKFRAALAGAKIK